MRQLDVLLVTEGPSDGAFLTRVVERSLQDICFREVAALVNIPVNAVKAGGSRDESRADWIVRRAREESATIVLLHRDGTVDPAREIRQAIDPVRAKWPAEDFALLGTVVPVREMESWALADLTLLETVIGASIDPSVIFEGNFLSAPERLSDPKRTIREVVELGRRPRRRKPSAEAYLPSLGENLGLDELRRLPSFRSFEDGIISLLDDLGWRTR